MLVVQNLEVRYGRLAAVRGVCLEVKAGEVVCVIGPNGAGKSSLFAAIAGGVAPFAGSVTFDGKAIFGARPEQIARLGLSLIPEGRHVFATLTVEENLRLGAFLGRGDPIENRLARIFAHFPRLAERRRLSAAGLSGGEQQMLVIGRALMTSPRLMLVDEPSLGLAPRIVDQVYEILGELKRTTGLTLLINEQSSKRVLKNADRIYVLRNGEIKLTDEARNLQDGEAIKHAYFGFDAAKPVKGALA